MIEVNRESQPGKRIALFFDGTWNVQGDNTNVWRLYLMTADSGHDGVRQIKYYDEGVGTTWFDSLSGGAFGYGLSENVRNAYRWLMECYDPGDEVYIFGFSRGAFTARSLAGLIARCGLLKPDAPMSFMQLYERYQLGTDTAKPIYDLQYEARHNPREFPFEEKVLINHSHYKRDLITMVGVWDTVGSLGVPFGDIKMVSRRTLKFHNTRLSTTVKHSYHALALDEYRSPYSALLWTTFQPRNNESDSAGKRTDNRFVEQRWFAGAHANVGGGYREDLFAERPLAWIQIKAADCGLSFRSLLEVSGDDLNALPYDSYSEFLRGIWRIAHLGRKHIRPVFAYPIQTKTINKKGEEIDGIVFPVNERIDASVFLRLQNNPKYIECALAIREWAARSNVPLEILINDPDPAYSAPIAGPGIEESQALLKSKRSR